MRQTAACTSMLSCRSLCWCTVAKGSAGRFRSLAQLYAFHGQQAVCFSYDDRASLVHSSGELITALEGLSGQMQNRQLSVLGHSMGGLVARKALERNRPIPGSATMWT